jgi:hypothetical protein
MGVKTQDIIKRLREKGTESAAYFGALPPDAWSQQVYDTGSEWDVRQVLCHFVAAESSFERIFAAAMGSGEALPENFNIDAFNAESVGKMGGMLPDALVEQFQRTRAGTIRFLESIDDPDLERQSWHPWFGWDKLEKFLKLVYRHNMLHERDVRKALDSGHPVPPSE